MGNGHEGQEVGLRGRKIDFDGVAKPAGKGPEDPDEGARRTEAENQRLRLRLQAAEEVLEDLGQKSQEAVSIASENERQRNEIEQLRATATDLEAKLAACEGARQRVGGSPPEPSARSTGVAGALSEVPLSEVVQMLAVNRKTGTLVISAEGPRDGGTCSMWFRDGQVVGCEFVKADEAFIDEEGFYAAAAVSGGSFAFASEGATFEPRMSVPVQQLLLEAARRLDEGTRESPR